MRGTLDRGNSSELVKLAADVPASSTLTRELLGWVPTHPGLIEDLERGHYLEAVPAVA
jgi:hypothetical protein